MKAGREFELFRAAVLAEPALEERLKAIVDWPTFVETAIASAAERGIALTDAQVQAARAAATRAWLDRWV